MILDSAVACDFVVASCCSVAVAAAVAVAVADTFRRDHESYNLVRPYKAL